MMGFMLEWEEGTDAQTHLNKQSGDFISVAKITVNVLNMW